MTEITTPVPAITTDTDLRTFSGADLLHYVKLGKRGKHFFAVCDEIDRRVINRVTAGKALTEPIVAALAILDKRGIVHTGPLAKDADVLTTSEKIKSPSSTSGVPDDYRYSDGAAALTTPAPKVVDRKALIAQANEVAAVLAERLCLTNNKGHKENLKTARRIVKREMGLV